LKYVFFSGFYGLGLIKDGNLVFDRLFAFVKLFLVTFDVFPNLIVDKEKFLWSVSYLPENLMKVWIYFY